MGGGTKAQNAELTPVDPGMSRGEGRARVYVCGMCLVLVVRPVSTLAGGSATMCVTVCVCVWKEGGMRREKETEAEGSMCVCVCVRVTQFMVSVQSWTRTPGTSRHNDPYTQMPSCIMVRDARQYPRKQQGKSPRHKKTICACHARSQEVAWWGVVHAAWSVCVVTAMPYSPIFAEEWHGTAVRGCL